MRLISEPGSVNDALSCVMVFLYVTYILVYAVINPLIGNWLDGVSLEGYNVANLSLRDK